MNDAVTMQSNDAAVQEVLRDQLAQGDAVLASIAPVLGHLLASNDQSLFTDEIVSRVRGMVAHIARQLVISGSENPEGIDPRELKNDQQLNGMTTTLLSDPSLVAHCHSLALEWQLTMKLEKRSAIDPVLSPLLQALIASDDAPVASGAMAALAAQARFVQQQRRMELPIEELPAGLFDRVLANAREAGGMAPQPIAKLRSDYRESEGRLALMAKLISGMGSGAVAALSVRHAGLAIFLSALAAATHQDRDLAAVATNERQLARLALALRAAGLRPREVEEQVLHIHPDLALPSGFNMLRADHAAALLAASGRRSVA
ncbi:hypothetical protein ACWPM1_08585 [Tsuneonella sp. HG249]